MAFLVLYPLIIEGVFLYKVQGLAFAAGKNRPHFFVLGDFER